jgi:hypothetical protein
MYRVSGLSLRAMMAPALTLHSSAMETMIAEMEVMSQTAGHLHQRPPRVLFTSSAAPTDSVSMTDSSAMVIQTVVIGAMKRVVEESAEWL